MTLIHAECQRVIHHSNMYITRMQIYLRNSDLEGFAYTCIMAAKSNQLYD